MSGAGCTSALPLPSPLLVQRPLKVVTTWTSSPQPSHVLCVQASLGFSMSAWPVTVAAALLKHWLLRASWDSVADGNGLLLLSDNVHLSDRGADIIAAEVGAVMLQPRCAWSQMH